MKIVKSWLILIYFHMENLVSMPEHLLSFEKVEILEKQKSVLNKVKHFIDSDPNPKKRNFLNPDKDNYNPITMSIENILEF